MGAVFYLEGIKVTALSQLTKVDRRTIDKYLVAAETWLDSRLEVLCEMAA